MDLAAAAALVVLLAPLLMFISIAIKATSKGPVFFLQRRVGLRGQPFLIFKFRTMTTLDDGDAIQQARADDQRVTAVGSFLRRTSLDELPQLFNVLSGEMSLVGPRPHAVAHDEDFLKRSSEYRTRQRARPGITGLAQVSGARGEITDEGSFLKRVRFDSEYVARQSIAFDIWILIKTCFLVLGDPKAH